MINLINAARIDKVEYYPTINKSKADDFNIFLGGLLIIEGFTSFRLSFNLYAGERILHEDIPRDTCDISLIVDLSFLNLQRRNYIIPAVEKS